MTSKQTAKMARLAEKSLQLAVREELQRKALLGQYVIINHNGKACKISARQALRMSAYKSKKH